MTRSEAITHTLADFFAERPNIHHTLVVLIRCNGFWSAAWRGRMATDFNFEEGRHATAC